VRTEIFIILVFGHLYLISKLYNKQLKCNNLKQKEVKELIPNPKDDFLNRKIAAEYFPRMKEIPEI